MSAAPSALTAVFTEKNARLWNYRLAAICTIAALLLAVTSVREASAHSTSYYPNRWYTNTTIDYVVDETFPGGSTQARLNDGIAQWNSAAGTNEPTFAYAGVSNVLNESPCSVPRDGGMVWTELNGVGGTSVAGRVQRCYNSQDYITKITVAFDISAGGYTWYTGTGDASSGVWRATRWAMPPDGTVISGTALRSVLGPPARGTRCAKPSRGEPR